MANAVISCQPINDQQERLASSGQLDKIVILFEV